MTSVERRVLSYLKSNPGATPREVADALGLPYRVVRVAIMRLRESGYVVRSSRGGYLVRVSMPSPDTSSVTAQGRVSGSESISIAELVDLIESLRSDVNELKARVGRLEQELNLLKKGLSSTVVSKKVRAGRMSHPQDPLLATLRGHGVVRLSEARKLAVRNISEYVSEGKVVPIGEYLVDPEFLSSFKQRFPLRVSDVRGLSEVERNLLNALIKEGLVYLHAGREYRLVE